MKPEIIMGLYLVIVSSTKEELARCYVVANSRAGALEAAYKKTFFLLEDTPSVKLECAELARENQYSSRLIITDEDQDFSPAEKAASEALKNAVWNAPRRETGIAFDFPNDKSAFVKGCPANGVLTAPVRKFVYHAKAGAVGLIEHPLDTVHLAVFVSRYYDVISVDHTIVSKGAIRLNIESATDCDVMLIG